MKVWEIVEKDEENQYINKYGQSCDEVSGKIDATLGHNMILHEIT